MTVLMAFKIISD